MKIICAWCEKELGEKEPFEDTKTTHSICNECSEKLVEEDEIASEEIKSAYKLFEIEN